MKASDYTGAGAVGSDTHIGTARDKTLAVVGLVTGAVVWGLIWYPMRVLELRGLLGSVSTAYVYGVALVISLLLFWRQLGQARTAPVALLCIGVVAGWTNLAYVLAVIEGEVMRVMLLFYLAPLWTVLLARALLGERPGRVGLLVVLLSLAGAVTMLWNPSQGWPVPTNRAEWLGLSSGMGFALSNVLIRRADHVGIPVKAVAVFVGVTALSALWSVLDNGPRLATVVDGYTWALVAIIGLVILATNLAVQYGLSRTSATQAIVILLFELVVAALASYFLAGEQMSLQEWAGGILIVAASLLSGRLEPESGNQPTPVLDEGGKLARSTRG